ncbi:zinc finger protein 493-like [Sardina pilchardus]|uniref:zinc finger protein 493-like n=1 Tax=Sardina pilchardus TaxID=27697 RepID=UPI002E0F1A4C
MKMPGSSFKICVGCQARMAVAQKKCPSCAVQQPHKQQKKNKIKKIIEKPPSAQNAGKVLDGVIVGLHKLKAVGFYPLLLVGKKSKTGFKAQLLHLDEQLNADKMEAFNAMKEVFEKLLNYPVSLAQMKRLSVVLVNCCRPQGRRGKEWEMQTQTDGDAEQPETNPVSLAQMKRVSVVLVDCCRPQGRRGKEEEMQTQTNGDAQHQTETSKRPETMNDVKKDEFVPSVMVKEKKYGHKMPCQDEEEKQFAELHCRTETDVTESNVTCNETQTKLEKKVEDVTDYQLESVSEHQHVTQQKLHGDNDDLNLETEDRPHRCTQCGKAFSRRDHLSRHMLVHTGEKSHRCTQCGKAFSCRYNLSCHMLVHTGEKSHKCIQCGKGFSRRHHLSRHMLVHTREKSHKCMQCGKSFSRKPNLSRHMLAHKGVNPVGPRQLVKEGDTNDEEYGRMIGEDKDEEKPFAELHCRSETDVSDAIDDTLQTVKIEVKKDEDEHDNLLESVSEHQHVTQQKLHGDNDDLSLQLNGRPHHCTVCRKSFTTLTELEKHQQTHSVWVNGKKFCEKPRKYSHCEQTSTTPSLVNHNMLTGDRPHKCTQCGKGFSYRSNLSQHMLVHTGEKSHKCTVCEKAFSSISTLSRHMLVHTGEKSHKCTRCGKGFSYRSSLSRHMLVFKGLCTHTGDRPHKCAHCGKGFSQIQQLKKHMLVHTGEKPYKCAYCGKAFRYPSSLKVHERLHTGDCPHKCTKCGKGFSCRSSLSQHMRIYKGMNCGTRRGTPSICPQCGRGFSKGSALKIHMLIHIGEKPHICVQCGKKLTTASNLKKHMLTHTGEKPHKCVQCEKAFSMISSLKRHMLIHTGEKPHKCDLCGKTFRASSSLIYHLMTHADKSLHECAQCGRAFRTQKMLRNHMLIHNRKWKCYKCGKAFPYPSVLKIHMISHTGDII